jgi:hypothetical protein
MIFSGIANSSSQSERARVHQEPWRKTIGTRNPRKNVKAAKEGQLVFFRGFRALSCPSRSRGFRVPSRFAAYGHNAFGNKQATDEPWRTPELTAA